MVRIPIFAMVIFVGSICHASDMIVIPGGSIVQVIKVTQVTRVSDEAFNSKVFICANKPNANLPQKCQFEIELISPDGQPLSEDDAHSLQKSFKTQLAASVSPLDCRSLCKVIRPPQ